MPADYVPDRDADFDTWITNFVTLVNAAPTNYGETLSTATVLSDARDAWALAYADHIAAQNAAQAAKQTKDAARAAVEAALRPMVNRMQASSQVDDTERASLGITIRDTIKTPVGAPVSRPVVQVDTSQRLRHTISFADEGNPASKAKPSGIQGCEIWVKVGGSAPLDASELTFLATDTRTPYLATYDGTEGGQVAHYMCRWVSSRGEPGPWSETASATIGA